MNGSDAHYLMDILALLLATVIVVPVFHAIRLGAILGYLTAGAILGPWGFAVITEVEQIRHLAEFGVIFLLFVLGIELKPDKLWQMRKMVIMLGLGQLLLTATLLYSVAAWLGVENQTAIVIGFGLALSSTAFCLQILSQRGGISTVMGRMAFSILLLQDLAVVPLLAMVSSLAGNNTHAEQGIALGYSILVIIALLVAGRYLLNPVLNKVVASNDPEVFIAMALLLVLGVAWIMQSVGFSMALGAFLAGVMLAESHYRHQIEADILPFRGILLGLFFMTVGMGIDFGLLLDKLSVIIGLTIGLMVVKALVVYLLARVHGTPHDISLQTAVLLSQSGEFGFVMFGFATLSGVLEPQLSQMLILIIALSMVLTPFAVMLANFLNLHFYIPKAITGDGRYPVYVDETQAHIILAGFGRVGARIAAILNEAGVPYIAMDTKHERVKAARAQGFPVFYGDASNVKVLQSAGAERAKMIVVTLDSPDQVDRLVSLVHQYYPDMPIHARARDRLHCAELINLGATTAISETLETSLRLTEDVLLGSGVSQHIVNKVLSDFREDYYSNVVQKVTENKVVLGELKH